MPKPGSLNDRLRRAGVRSFDELIHDQSREWLIENFKEGATDYPVNISRLMRNLVWQLRERIQRGEKEPLKELIRTFWYMYVKPTLSRAGALAEETDQYAQLTDNLAAMVRDFNVLRYKDIGFRDDNENNRRLGKNANVIVVGEKAGAMGFLLDLHARYDVTVIALGGQPSLLSVEYLTDAIRAAGVNLKRSFYLFSIVDFDPSGWIIQQAFLNDLAFYGLSHTRVTELITPDRLLLDEVLDSRFRIPDNASMRTKNKAWLAQVRARHYKNQPALEEAGVLYGLEAESVSTARLHATLESEMAPLLGKSEDLLKIYELRQVEKAIQELILFKISQ